jgi:mannose-6-phosphate isomerase-like protein (cupin superfamily)
MAKKHVHKWTDLPKTPDAGGLIQRAGFRQDHGLLLFTWIDASLKRLAPVRASFDKIILNFDGETFVEIDGKAYRLTPRSMIRIPADASHSIWPAGGESVFFIEVGAPGQPLAALADWQDGFDTRSQAPAPAAPRAQQDFKGEHVKDTTGVVFEWDKLKREPKYEGAMMRTAFKSRGSLVTFNYIDPSIKKQPPHNHDFDQIIMIADGAIRMYLEGEPLDVGPRSIVYVKGGLMHAGGPEGGEPVLNMDVFSPPRPDYVYLADYQGKF